ncbi:hypothetical protein [Thioalkalivibrio sulfidiphilus]|uniref:hypothetical protein n=1 Tax=Thioalkalivibrio sulfidiphilus TaxID=1033854 RepID=UPI003B34BB5F
MAPFSQMLEPPQNPGRFTLLSKSPLESELDADESHELGSDVEGVVKPRIDGKVLSLREMAANVVWHRLSQNYRGHLFMDLL